MTKGTPSKGRHSRGKSHIRCRRCGNPSFHVKRSICASCGFGRSKTIRDYKWNNKKVLTHVRKSITKRIHSKGRVKRKSKANKLHRY